LAAAFAALAATVLCAPACREAEQPAYYEVVTLSGTPYERGFTHGLRFASRIRSLYTSLLTNSLLPYLNREQPDIEAVLTEYQKPIYDNGQFSYQLMLQSGQNLAKFIPDEYMEEMRGIADGAALPFDQVLILNTFLDTMLGFRAITFFIRQLQSPYIQSVEFAGGSPTAWRPTASTTTATGMRTRPARRSSRPTRRTPTPRWWRCPPTRR